MKQVEAKDAGDEEAHLMDEDYIRALNMECLLQLEKASG